MNLKKLICITVFALSFSIQASFAGHNPPLNRIQQSVHGAILENDLNAVVHLAQDRTIRGTRDPLTLAAIHTAISEASQPIVEHLLSFEDLYRCKGDLGNNILHTAVKNRKAGIAELILTKLPHMNFGEGRNSRGEIPLHLAHDLATFDVLLRNYPGGTREAIRVRDSQGVAVFHSAIKNGLNEFVISMVKNDASLVFLTDHFGKNSLHYAIEAARTGLATYEMLEAVAKFAAIPLRDNRGATAVHYAAKLLKGKNLELILNIASNDYQAIGYAIKSLDHHGATPLHYAVLSRNTDAVYRLLKLWYQGKNQKTTQIWSYYDGSLSGKALTIEPGSTPADLAQKIGYSEIFDRNVSKVSNLKMKYPKVQDLEPIIQGLKHAANSRNPRLEIQNFLKQGSSLLSVFCGIGKESALHFALKSHTNELAELLVRVMPESRNHQDDRGDTPLHQAIRVSRSELVNLLMTPENLTIRNKDGQIPRELAESLGQTQIVQMLLRPLLQGLVPSNISMPGLHQAMGTGTSLSQGSSSSITAAPVTATSMNSTSTGVQAPPSRSSVSDFARAAHEEVRNIHRSIISRSITDIIEIIQESPFSLKLRSLQDLKVIYPESKDPITIPKGSSARDVARLVGSSDELNEVIAKELPREPAIDELGLEVDLAEYFRVIQGVNSYADFIRSLTARGGFPKATKYLWAYGFTPLHSAVWNNHVGLIRIISKLIPVERSALGDYQGNTPLHLAVIRNHHQAVELLMNPESLSKRNDAGKTPYQLAMDLGRTELIKKIDRYLAKATMSPSPLKRQRIEESSPSTSSPILVLAPKSGTSSSGTSSSGTSSSGTSSSGTSSSGTSSSGSPRLSQTPASPENRPLFTQVRKKTHSTKNIFLIPDNLLSLDHQTGSDRRGGSGLHYQPMGPKIRFSNVGLLPIGATPRVQQKLLQTSDKKMKGTYYTLNRQGLPGPQEQVSIVLAGRGENAYVPEAKPGTRVILLLASPSQKDIARKLLRNRVDVFLLEHLFYQQAPLSETEIRLVTARRVAAFHLASLLKLNQVAVLDDNIEEIQISEPFWIRVLANDLKESPEAEERLLSWSELFNLMNRQYMNEYATIGLKGVHPLLIKVQPIDQFQVIDHGPYSADSSFGQKVLFFNMEKVKQAVGERFDVLFPPGVQLPQEDLFYQIYLARANQKVGHVSRKSLLYVRNQGQLAKPACLESEEWLRLPEGVGLTEIQKATIQQIQVSVREEIERKKQQKERQMSQPIPSRKGKEKMDEDLPAQTAAPQTLKRKREESATPAAAPIVAPRGGTGLRTDRPGIAALDQDSNWKAYGEALKQSSNPFLRPYQNAALVNLGKSIFKKLDGDSGLTNRDRIVQKLEQFWLFRGSNSQSEDQAPSQPKNAGGYLGYFDLPTGTGKTEIFFEMVRLASLNLNGNIAIVLPTLTITSQTADRIKSIKAEIKKAFASASYPKKKISVYPISSEDVAARRAAINDPLTNGGNILIFCEKSFSIFVNQRKAEGGNLNDISLVIFDEMHKIPPGSASYIKELAAQPQTGVYGFSATPRRRIEMFGGPQGNIYRYTTEQALNDPAGPFLVPWKTRVMTFPQGQEAMLRLIPKILTQEKLPDQRLIAEGQGIIYLHNATAKKADAFARSLTQAGIPALAHHYKTTDSKRVLQDFREKRLRVLVALQTLREGFDAPVNWVFIAKAETQTKKTSKLDFIGGTGAGQKNKELDQIDNWIQIRGRALRLDDTQPNKVALVIVPDEDLAEDVISLKDHPQGGMDAPPKAWRLSDDELNQLKVEQIEQERPLDDSSEGTQMDLEEKSPSEMDESGMTLEELESYLME